MTFGQLVSLYFGYPAGAVWSNLIASAICAGLVWWRLHKQSARQHAEALVQAAKHQHEKLAQAEAQHKAQMELLRQQHSQMSDAVAGTGEPAQVTVSVSSSGDPATVAGEIQKALLTAKRRNPPGGGM